jgi:hypothetical protein
MFALMSNAVFILSQEITHQPTSGNKKAARRRLVF